MNKILHLCRTGNLADSFFKFINRNFDNNCHEFWIYGQRSSSSILKMDISLYKNVKYIRDIIEKLKTKEIYDFDKIIYHGVFDFGIIDFFARDRKLLKKLYLYFWGGDMFYVDNKWDNLKKKYVIKNACGIINVLPEEKRYMKKFYHPKGKFFCAQYYDSSHVELIMNLKKHKDIEKDFVAIQIGNSATRTNRHIYILNILSKFIDENVKIYAPLSYGDMEYANEVIRHGKKMFGKKFVPLTEYMSKEDYYQFLKNIDIAIFDMNRQQAGGNIEALLSFGKKIYFRDRSVFLHYYKEVNCCDVYTTNMIHDMEYDEFVHFSKLSKEKNMNKLEKLATDKEHRIEAWSKIFNNK